VSLDFAVALFDGEGTAVQRYSAAKGRTTAADPKWMGEIGFVERRHNGRVRLRGTFAGHYLGVDESDRVDQKGGAEGAIAGGLIGVLAGPPGIAVGLLVGVLVGRQAGPPDEVEDEPEALADQLREAVPVGSSAVVLIAGPADVDQMVAALGEDAQSVSRQTLTAEQAAALEASLGAAPSRSSEQ
jgi:uncharacterized membrane protein